MCDFSNRAEGIDDGSCSNGHHEEGEKVDEELGRLSLEV